MLILSPAATSTFGRIVGIAAALSPLLFPTGAAAGPPPATIPNSSSVAAALPDYQVDALRGGLIIAVPRAFAAPDIAVDSRYGWRFSRTAFIYRPLPSGDRIVAVGIHFDPSQSRRGEQTARLLARLLYLHRQHFRRDAPFPRGAAYADVWLASQQSPGSADVGGETRDNQVYIYAVGAPRSSLEWVRTVAHEWGHLTMYASRGFDRPENDAGGYLGERLYIKWMLGDRAAPPDDGVDAAGLAEYRDKQIRPLIDAWTLLPTSPRSPAQIGSLSPMDTYIAAVLAADESLGSTLTGAALSHTEGARPRDFYNALSGRVMDSLQSGPLPLNLPARVPLHAGRYAYSAGHTVTVRSPVWVRIDGRGPVALRTLTGGAAGAGH